MRKKSKLMKNAVMVDLSVTLSLLQIARLNEAKSTQKA